MSVTAAMVAQAAVEYVGGSAVGSAFHKTFLRLHDFAAANRLGAAIVIGGVLLVVWVLTRPRAL